MAELETIFLRHDFARIDLNCESRMMTVVVRCIFRNIKNRHFLYWHVNSQVNF